MWLSEAQAQQLITHAREDAPREACGIIIGRNERAVEILPIANAAVDPVHTYVMEERALAAALTSLERRGLQLVAFYHSHPNSDPIPSPTDIRQAAYPETPYLIVGLKGGTPALAAWKLGSGQVSEVPVTVGSAPPIASAPLSGAQKAAILLAALISVAVLVVVSLSLLPPAPVIPR